MGTKLCGCNFGGNTPETTEKDVITLYIYGFSLVKLTTITLKYLTKSQIKSKTDLQAKKILQIQIPYPESKKLD